MQRTDSNKLHKIKEAIINDEELKALTQQRMDILSGSKISYLMGGGEFIPIEDPKVTELFKKCDILIEHRVKQIVEFYNR